MVRVVDSNFQLDVKIKTPTGEDIPVPDDLVDPVSQEIIRDPVRLPCKHSIDRSYESNMDWVRKHGCMICRAKFDISQITFDQEKWERIKLLLAKEKPRGWSDRIQEFFAEFNFKFRRTMQLSIEYSPSMVTSLNYIAKPVYERALNVSLGRVKGMGVSRIQAEARFAGVVMLSVACLIRDLAASVLFLFGWLLNERFSEPMAKRISLIMSTVLQTCGMCYWQPANRRMYMDTRLHQEYYTMDRIERMEQGFVETAEYIHLQMARSLIEARNGLYFEFYI